MGLKDEVENYRRSQTNLETQTVLDDAKQLALRQEQESKNLRTQRKTRQLTNLATQSGLLNLLSEAKNLLTQENSVKSVQLTQELTRTP